jgi:diguanylate cyclase (GGDEF)-like protein/PAS domain S-box-containing protein
MREENPFEVALDSLFDGVYMTDRERGITYWNQGAERITGFTAAEAIGKHCWDNILKHLDCDGTPLCHSHCTLAQTLVDGNPRETQAFLHHKLGHRVPVRIRVHPLRNASGDITGAVEVFTDNFAPQEAAERIAELERMAYLDPLTGIANRRYAEISLNLTLNEYQRYAWPFGVILMDVDRFKEINDTRGHDAGDRVLKTVAATLTGCSRPFDVISRWGGDEFLAVVKMVEGDELFRVAKKFCSLVERSDLSLLGGDIQVTLSCGGAMVQPDDTQESILNRADNSLYSSKAAGRNCASL